MPRTRARSLKATLSSPHGRRRSARTERFAATTFGRAPVQSAGASTAFDLAYFDTDDELVFYCPDCAEREFDG